MPPELDQAAENQGPLPHEVTVDHAKAAEPGNIVQTLDTACGLLDAPGLIRQHASHEVPHPSQKNGWITRETFRLHILNDVKEAPDGSLRTTRVVTHREPAKDELETFTVWNDAAGKDETRQRPKDPSYTHQIHASVAEAAKRCGLSVRALYIDAKGAELEFRKVQ